MHLIDKEKSRVGTTNVYLQFVNLFCNTIASCPASMYHISDIPESIFQLVVSSQIGSFWLLYKESGVYYAHNKLVGKSLIEGLGLKEKVYRRFQENASTVWPSFQIFFFFNTIFTSRFLITSQPMWIFSFFN